MLNIDITDQVLKEVLAERDRQEVQWGQQNHPPFAWLTILGEEYGESCQAALKSDPHMGECTLGRDAYRKELIQVAAVAVAAVECLDRSEREASC